MPKKQKVNAVAKMSVYENCSHRTTGQMRPRCASVKESLTIFEELLTRLQKKGVKPGTELKITIEEL